MENAQMRSRLLSAESAVKSLEKGKADQEMMEETRHHMSEVMNHQQYNCKGQCCYIFLFLCVCVLATFWQQHILKIHSQFHCVC